MKYITFTTYIALSFLFSKPIITINDAIIQHSDFFSKYPKQEWDASNNEKKGQMINDYTKKLLCEKEAISLGFLNKPEIAIKLRNRSQMVLVNSVYEYRNRDYNRRNI